MVRTYIFNVKAGAPVKTTASMLTTTERDSLFHVVLPGKDFTLPVVVLLIALVTEVFTDIDAFVGCNTPSV